MNKVRAYFPKSGHFIQFSRKGRVASPLLPPIFLLVAPLYCYFWADCLPLCGSLEAKACGELQIYAAPNFLHCYKGSEEHYEFVQSLNIQSLLVWIDQYLEDVLYWQWRHIGGVLKQFQLNTEDKMPCRWRVFNFSLFIYSQSHALFGILFILLTFGSFKIQR